MRMPEPFDLQMTVARYQEDNTRYLRAKFPRLDWVWDELDELRAVRDSVVSSEEYEELEQELNAAEKDRDAARLCIREALAILDESKDVERAAAKLAEIAE